MSINSEILAIKTAGLNHKQIKQVLIADEPNRQKDTGYPLLRIWPVPGRLSTVQGDQRQTTSYDIIVMDRHEEDSQSELEAISDSHQILLDLVATLKYMYKGMGFSVNVNDSIQTYYDRGEDIAGGVGTTIEFSRAYTQDFCQVLSRDFDFPVVNLSNLRVIDEGGATATYTGPFIIDGGIA